ncbi:MAG: hypothetical protein JWQ34_2633 [Mucilaginibacter sp.]|uniref:TlpA family protein disulfide reductase n=1 Tax=Mucilaginibacter sp. TaxID=1882438 RepID=UPI00261E274F|nr:hypothetical protein [Mucilaginibacter sp.]MDB5004408.1 hypothetical protein [Mucilaginibacter sp.]
MKLKLGFAGAILCLLIANIAKAQSIKPLKVGDKCPEIIIGNMLNSKSSAVKLSALKGKLVIIELATVYCGPCKETAHKLDSLRKNVFGERLYPIFVTSEEREKVNVFLQKDPIGKTLGFLYVYGDKKLTKYFPHTFTPHEVWINQKGVVIAITDHHYVTKENIQKVLNGEAVDWPVKYDAFDDKAPLIVLNKANFPMIKDMPRLITYSAFSNHIDGVSSSFLLKWNPKPIYGDSSDRVRISMVNLPVVVMYLWAFDKAYTTFPISQLILEVKDKSKYSSNGRLTGDNLPPSTDQVVWNKENTYCYNAEFLQTVPEHEVRKNVLAQLDYSLGVHGRLEKRQVDCWVLSGNLKSNFPFKKEVPIDSIYDVKNRPAGYAIIGNLVWYASRVPNNPPFLSEVTVPEQVRVWITKQVLSDIDQLNSALNKYGLVVKKAKREVEMLVITENGYINKP